MQRAIARRFHENSVGETSGWYTPKDLAHEVAGDHARKRYASRARVGSQAETNPSQQLGAL